MWRKKKNLLQTFKCANMLYKKLLMSILRIIAYDQIWVNGLNIFCSVIWNNMYVPFFVTIKILYLWTLFFLECILLQECITKNQRAFPCSYKIFFSFSYKLPPFKKYFFSFCILVSFIILNTNIKSFFWCSQFLIFYCWHWHAFSSIKNF